MTYTPTMQLRWLAHYDKHQHDINIDGPNKHGSSTLQQAWIGEDGSVFWQDIEVVEEDQG